MSIPLDRLYNFLHDVCNQDVLIYRFIPHGSRKVDDCKPLFDYSKDFCNIKMICHDQETLNFKDYCFLKTVYQNVKTDFYPVFNVILDRYSKRKFGIPEHYSRSLLLHSEMQSNDVAWFEQDGSVGVYWWSHAVIARDWFRYAEVDPRLGRLPFPQKDFLIYNRAWTGLREYRLKFVELVLDYNLQDHCQLTFNPVDDGKHWREHKFLNNAFVPSRTDLDQHFQPTSADATASADYNSLDYVQTAFEVVLETVFDDTKWHLTEKSLRPIACGQPFILAGTPGVLQYLRRYGFQTFGEYIDESYDSIQDPVQRLEAIVKLMQSISRLPAKEKQQLYSNLAPICEHNKSRFFSTEFFDQVIGEFQTNFAQGFAFIQQSRSDNDLEIYVKNFGEQ
jgi:hypothetical protein